MIGKQLGYLDGSFDGSNDGKLEILLIGYSLGYNDGKVLGYDESIKLGLSGDKFFGTILLNVYGIILGLDVGTQLDSLDGYFDGSNDGKLECLFLGGSLGYTDGKVLGSDEVIKLGYTDGKVFGTILGNVDIITLGIDIGTELGCLDVPFDGSNEGNLEGFLLG